MSMPYASRNLCLHLAQLSTSEARFEDDHCWEILTAKEFSARSLTVVGNAQGAPPVPEESQAVQHCLKHHLVI